MSQTADGAFDPKRTSGNLTATDGSETGAGQSRPATLLAHAQQTELKRLWAAPRCRMHVPAFRDQSKSITQNRAKPLRVVSYDWQAAALLRTVECKRGDNRMATRT